MGFSNLIHAKGFKPFKEGFFCIYLAYCMTEADIEKLAELAKIKLPEGKAEAFLNDFESILGYVKQIEGVEIGEVKESFFLKNILRVDADPNPTGALTDALLAAAPETHDGFVKVNKIL